MAWQHKTELVQQELDEWMIRWRHYQTMDDWNIEKRHQKRRQRNFGIAAATFVGLAIYTAAPATVKRVLSPPHFFDIGFDAAIKTRLRDTINGVRRYTPNGYGRILCTYVPTYFVFQWLERRCQITRMKEYLKVETVFGEQHRRRITTGKIEEFLAVRIQASVPESEAVVYPHA